MAFGIENVEVVGFARSKAEGVQVYGTRDLSVLATDVYHQFVIDEHPHVVVTQEVEVLARNVFERGLHLHGKAEIMVCVIFTTSLLIIIRVRNSTCFVKILEIVQQEHTATVGFVTRRNSILRNFGQPETCTIHRDVQVAASHVGKLVALSIDSQGFREKPRTQVFSNLAVFGERSRRNRHTVCPQLGFDHAAHGATATAARTEVCANTIFGVTVTVYAITLVTMQPVEHHDRKLFQGAFTQNASRVFCINARFAFLVALDPNGVAKGGHGVKLDFGGNVGLRSGKTLCAHKVFANSLLKVNSEVFSGGLDCSNEPSAVIVQRNHGGGGTIYKYLCVGIGPRRKEADNLHAFGKLTRIVFTRATGIVTSTWATRICLATGESTLRCEFPSTIVRNGDSCLLRSRVQIAKRNAFRSQEVLAASVSKDVQVVIGQDPTTFDVETHATVRNARAARSPFIFGIVVNSVVEFAFVSSCKRIRRRESRGN